MKLQLIEGRNVGLNFGVERSFRALFTNNTLLAALNVGEEALMLGKLSDTRPKYARILGHLLFRLRANVARNCVKIVATVAFGRFEELLKARSKMNCREGENFR